MLDSIIPVYDNSLQGKDSPNSKFHGKIPNSLCMNLIKYIDTKHEKGNNVACREILNCLWKKHSVYFSKHTLSRDMLDIGQFYKTNKQTKIYIGRKIPTLTRGFSILSNENECWKIAGRRWSTWLNPKYYWIGTSSFPLSAETSRKRWISSKSGYSSSTITYF